MSEITYGQHCFDQEYYNKSDRGGFPDIDYHSEIQQDQLSKKLGFIDSLNIDYHTILFVGCATGNEPRYFLDKGKDAQGCDISKYAISQADPIISANIKEYDGQNLNWQADNSIDVVCAFDVLTIIPKKQREILISEMVRVASKLIVIRTSLKVPDDLTDKEFDGIDGAPFKLATFSYWDKVFVRNKKFWLKKAEINSHKHDHREAVIAFSREN